MPSPVLPRNLKAPIMTGQITKRATGKVRRIGKEVRQRIVALFEQIPHRRIDSQTGRVVNHELPDRHWLVPNQQTRYEYQLSATGLQALNDEISGILGDLWLGSDQVNPGWWLYADVESAYEQGTAESINNLSVLSDEFTKTLDAEILSQPYTDRLAFLQTRVFESMKGFAGDAATDLAETLSRGMLAGQGPREIAKAVRERTGVSESRALRIARTEINMAHRRARFEQADDAQQRLGIRTGLLHISALSPTTRKTHAQRHGRVYAQDEVREWYSMDGNGINCYVPGTRVRGRFVAGSKAFYRGMVVELVTINGRNLTVTPNHPVMTDRGLIAAGEITKGDNLVAYGRKVEDSGRVSDLDDNHAGAAIEDVFSSLSDVGESGSLRVMGVDFHGDAVGMDENVDTVFIEGVLNIAVDSAMPKLLKNLALVKANPMAMRPRSFYQGFVRVLLSAPTVVSRLRSRLPELRSAFTGAQKCRFRLASLPLADAFKPISYGRSGHSVLDGKLLNGGSAGVLGKKLLYVKSAFGACVSSCAKPLGLKPLAKSSAGNANLCSDALNGLAGAASLDKVVDIKITSFAGHVYDLQEVSGLMVANGIISSNCKCSQTEVLVDEDGNPADTKLIERLRKRSERFLAAGGGK